MEYAKNYIIILIETDKSMYITMYRGNISLTEKELLKIIKRGECHTTEFKKSTTDITKDVYESICAFSNRDGGHIVLGIRDDGEIVGIKPNCIEKMKKDFVNAVNNPSKIYPPLFLKPVEYEIDEKKILYIYVPVGTQVSRCSGRIYDRNNEADIDITDNEELVYKLYTRKQGTYFVNKVFPEWGIDTLRTDLMERARKMTRARGNNHPWLSMNDEEMLRSAGLILMDNESRREGITLAAILLFGKDISIMSALPQHKTDAIFRVENKDRYDDREIGLADELGSGMRNTYKYTKLYSGKNPAFEEGDIFKTIIPLKRIATKKVGGQSISDQVSDQVRNNDVMTKILGFCEIARTKKEISEYIGYKNLTYMTRTFIKPLLEMGKLEYTIPEKPQSRLQKYVAKR